jgi:hypothetical protein
MPGKWTGLIADTAEPRHEGPVLGDIASFTADFRDQYYGLVGAVSDAGDGPPLITSGLIDPNECWWGRRRVRFAKQELGGTARRPVGAVTESRALGTAATGAEDPHRQPDAPDRGRHRPRRQVAAERSR